MLLSGCSSSPADGSTPSLVSVSFSFVLGFFATGGGSFAPLVDSSVSPSAVGEEMSWFFCAAALLSVNGLVSTTTFLLFLAKMKLAVLEGDLRRSGGDVGECRLRRALGPPRDLAAVRRRIASCRFIDGDTEAAAGGLTARDGTDAAGIGRGSGLGAGGCKVTTAGGDVGGGTLIIRDFLMGFCGASVLEVEAGVLFLMTTSVSGFSCTRGAWSAAVCRREGGTEGLDSSCTTGAGGTRGLWSSVLAGLDSFWLGRPCTGEDGGEGRFTGSGGTFCSGGALSGPFWLAFSDGAELERSWTAA